MDFPGKIAPSMMDDVPGGAPYWCCELWQLLSSVAEKPAMPGDPFQGQPVHLPSPSGGASPDGQVFDWSEATVNGVLCREVRAMIADGRVGYLLYRPLEPPGSGLVTLPGNRLANFRYGLVEHKQTIPGPHNYTFIAGTTIEITFTLLPKYPAAALPAQPGPWNGPIIPDLDEEFAELVAQAQALAGQQVTTPGFPGKHVELTGDTRPEGRLRDFFGTAASPRPPKYQLPAVQPRGILWREGDDE